MRTIVFGGSGFLGSHVADALTDAGYKVRIFDLKKSPYLQENQEMIVGDILNFEHVSNAVKDCYYVYNFAGIADLYDAKTKPKETVRLNIEGTINILEACRLNCHQKVTMVSLCGSFIKCLRRIGNDPAFNLIMPGALVKKTGSF